MASTDLGSKLPAGPADVTREWLTAVLRDAGALDSAAVAAVDTSVIGAGAGFLGQLVRARLQYDKPEDGAPASVIVKLPAAQQENRQVAMFFRFYEREVRFYEQIADDIDLRTPRCYFSRFDTDTGDYALVLEDLDWATMGDQLAGCKADSADLCIRELAKFHATWWGHPQLDKLEWMPRLDEDWYIASVEQSYGQAWEPFEQFFGDRMSPGVRDIARRFVDHIGVLMRRFSTEPRTVVHGDYRLDNLFFGPPQREPLAVIDWQITTRARGTFDLAYFACGTLPPEERKRNEQALIKQYHGILTENGVSGYSLDDCLEDYRAGVLFCIVYAVIAMGSLDMANQRGVDLFTTIATRTTKAIGDLDCGEFLRDGAA